MAGQGEKPFPNERPAGIDKGHATDAEHEPVGGRQPLRQGGEATLTENTGGEESQRIAALAAEFSKVTADRSAEFEEMASGPIRRITHVRGSESLQDGDEPELQRTPDARPTGADIRQGAVPPGVETEAIRASTATGDDGLSSLNRDAGGGDGRNEPPQGPPPLGGDDGAPQRSLEDLLMTQAQTRLMPREFAALETLINAGNINTGTLQAFVGFLQMTNRDRAKHPEERRVFDDVRLRISQTIRGETPRVAKSAPAPRRLDPALAAMGRGTGRAFRELRRQMSGSKYVQEGDPKLEQGNYAGKVRVVVFGNGGPEGIRPSIRGQLQGAFMAPLRRATGEAKVRDARALLVYESTNPARTDDERARAREAIAVIDEEIAAAAQQARERTETQEARRAARVARYGTNWQGPLGPAAKTGLRAVAGAAVGLGSVAAAQWSKMQRKRSEAAARREAAPQSELSNFVQDIRALAFGMFPDERDDQVRWRVRRTLRYRSVAPGSVQNRIEAAIQLLEDERTRAGADTDRARQAMRAIEVIREEVTRAEENEAARGFFQGPAGPAILKGARATRDLYRGGRRAWKALNENEDIVAGASKVRARMNRISEEMANTKQGAERGVVRKYVRQKAIEGLTGLANAGGRGGRFARRQLARGARALADSYKANAAERAARRASRRLPSAPAEAVRAATPEERTTALTREERAYILVEATKGRYASEVTQADIDAYIAMWERDADRGRPQDPAEAEAARKLNPIMFPPKRKRK